MANGFGINREWQTVPSLVQAENLEEPDEFGRNEKRCKTSKTPKRSDIPNIIKRVSRVKTTKYSKKMKTINKD